MNMRARNSLGAVGRHCGPINKGTLANFFQHGGSKSLPGAGDATADRVHGQIEDIHKTGHDYADGAANYVEDLLRRFIALYGHLVDDLSTEFRIFIHGPP